MILAALALLLAGRAQVGLARRAGRVLVGRVTAPLEVALAGGHRVLDAVGAAADQVAGVGAVGVLRGAYIRDW